MLNNSGLPIKGIVILNSQVIIISMINGLEIQNFRGIKYCKLEDLSQVNILVGRNNSGKSTILESIYFISSLGENYDEIRKIQKIDYLIRRRLEERIKEKIEKSITSITKMNNNIVNLTSPILDIDVFSQFFYNFDKNEKIIFNINIDNFTYFVEVTHKNYNQIELKTNVSDSISEIFKNVVFIDRNLSLSQLYDIIGDLKREKRKDKEIVKLLKEEFEVDVEGIEFSRYLGGFVLSLTLKDTSIPIDLLGDGAKLAVLISSILLYLEGKGIALIEEPELHEHPGGIYTLLNFAFKIAKEKGIQLFITTHSSDVIKYSFKIAKEKGLKTQLVYLRKVDGRVNSVNLTENNMNLLEEIGMDVRVLDVL
ncbi:AAA family ATPase [Saccharolobus islandicus]|uniref:Putative ATPase n=1 Tax=Saccharolobus islandicus LAL14/1 TaxID=1241935 RepID=M9U8B3_SACIS|nr:ATP-binding protein [Sulfolobus islandicus]AGJ62333.1 putative ATPase [Sulfolobus islandicus LAL14/1]